MAQGDVVGLAVTFTHAQIPGTSPVVTLAYQQQTANDGGNTDLAEALAIGGRVIDVLAADMTTDVFDDETTLGPCVVYGITKADDRRSGAGEGWAGIVHQRPALTENGRGHHQRRAACAAAATEGGATCLSCQKRRRTEAP